MINLVIGLLIIGFSVMFAMFVFQVVLGICCTIVALVVTGLKAAWCVVGGGVK